MNEIIVEAHIESMKDLWMAREGMIPNEEIRRATIPNALVDTNTTGLSLPMRLIDQMGLEEAFENPIRSRRGVVMTKFYDSVQLTVQGRTCIVSVTACPDDLPAVIGIVPLGEMDWVVDRDSRRLVGNPDHGGEWMLDLF